MEVTASKDIKMPLRLFSRQKTWLFPHNLDELITDDHSVRFIASFVDTIDENTWQQMGVDIHGDTLGTPAYHPRSLLSVWLFGFMTGAQFVANRMAIS